MKGFPIGTDTPLVVYYGKLVAWSVSSIPPFIVTITTITEYRCSLIGRPDLFCKRKYIVAPTLEASIQWVWQSLVWFFELSYKTFHLLPSRIKNGIFKNWIHFLLIFSLLFKIKHGQNITESYKRSQEGRTRQKIIRDVNEKSKKTNTWRTSTAYTFLYIRPYIFYVFLYMWSYIFYIFLYRWPYTFHIFP